MKNLVSKENTAAALASIGVDKAASCINVTAAQEFDVKMVKDSSDKESDGVLYEQDLEDDEKVSLLSDEEDGETASVEATVDKAVEDEATQALKPDKSTEDNLDEAPDDEDFVPGDKKKECQKCDIQPNPGTRDGPVCLDPTVVAVRQKEKCQVDHVSVQVVQQSMRVYLFKYLGLIKDDTILSKLFFYTDIMCKDGSIVPGGEWPSVDWMTDTPSLGAATRGMSWFMVFCHSCFLMFKQYPIFHILVNCP